MSKFMDRQKKIEKVVVSGYQQIEDTVVSAYKKVEDGFVGGYKKIEDKFVDTFLTPEDSTDRQDGHADDTQSAQPKGD